MSKLICTSAVDGAVAWVARAEAILDRAISAHGEDSPVGFPDTAYYLPVIYSFTGQKIQTLGHCRQTLRRAKELLPERPSDSMWLPYLGGALDAGVATLFACEIIEACKYVVGPSPVEGIWLGAANDIIMRERGIEFVDGTAPGFAAITGAAPSDEIAVRIAKELQQKNLYVFMAGATNGLQFAQQLARQNIQLGWETRLVPFGMDVSALIFALGFANRVALSFGGVKPGDYLTNLKYNKDRTFAFVIALGPVDADKYAAAAGAINYGFPTISDYDIPEILPTGVCTYEHVVSRVPHENIVERALEVRGCKVVVDEVPIPVAYGPAFEGERIRKNSVHAEFGGNRTTAFEFVTSLEPEGFGDVETTVLGPDIDTVEPGSAMPLALWVEVAGRKMQSDFEPILERQIHHFLNGAEGLWHMGQRDIQWTRISRDAYASGFRLKHLGEILRARFLSSYPAIVDKVRVTVITDPELVEQRIELARRAYAERNERVKSLTDESVDTFYSCLLCQSFAPDHVCVITPERLGLCGAYNWLDGKAAHEIDETGPNQPVSKGKLIDPVKGIWEGVNQYVYFNSHRAIEELCLYSIMDRPMTSCGCFEVILAYVPECNGVMAVNREFTGDTPVGMTFTTLAGSVGGGQQTPGFMGCGKVYLSSRKFLLAEGGHHRLVWLPSQLKQLLGEVLRTRFQEMGDPDFMDKIADETISTDPMEIRAFLENVGHPALALPDMSALVRDEAQESPGKVAPLEQSESPSPTHEPPVLEVASAAPQEETEMNPETLQQIKAEILESVTGQLKASLTRDIVQEIINSLSQKFLGHAQASPPSRAGPGLSSAPSQPSGVPPQLPASASESSPALSEAEPSPEAQVPPQLAPVFSTDSIMEESVPRAAERIQAISAFNVRCEEPRLATWTVTIGATKEQGGTRSRSITVGGSTAMPFHLWEGEIPFRPVVAMEVFDVVDSRYPPALRQVYGQSLERPPEMARICVERYGADLISVRLDGTHPETNNRSPEQAVELVKSVLEAVDVPLIITGHAHFERNNQVMKAVARECAGEKLLLNWVEQDNYRTIAGAAMAYGHNIVAQSPIDVNIAKQLNILLTNMSVDPEQIIIDPMTGALGYGIEYTYSIMERIRMTGLGGDQMLAAPMILSPGQECAKVKELRATQAEFPAWGDLEQRAAMWELTTATSMLLAGADILIMYHPVAAMNIKKTIIRLLDGTGES